MYLLAKNIVKAYTKQHKVTPVLKGVSLAVSEGDFVSIIGPSGAGKSTLLHILGGIDAPDSGEVIIEHNAINKTNSINATGNNSKYYYDYNAMNPTELANFRNQFIGFIFQFHHLLPEFSAIENIMLPALIAGDSYKIAKDKALRLLNLIKLDLRESHKPSELSGGEQQRVAIARALINNPKIVLADEPTGNLDRSNSQNILDILDTLQRELNITFIVATHSDEVAARSKRIVKMKDGLIEESL